jgi:hypothetical protein
MRRVIRLDDPIPLLASYAWIGGVFFATGFWGYLALAGG